VGIGRYPYGDTVRFTYGSQTLVLADEKFLPTNNANDGHLGVCGASFYRIDSEKMTTRLNPFGFGISEGRDAGEFLYVEFNLFNLTDAEKGFLLGVSKRQRIAREIPVRCDFRRIAMEHGSATRTRAKIAPDPAPPFVMTGVSYFYPKFDLFTDIHDNDFQLMPSVSCSNPVNRWMIRFKAKEYNLVPTTQDS